MQRSRLVLIAALLAAFPARADDSNRPLAQLKRAARVEELPAVSAPGGAPAEQRYWIVLPAATRQQRTAIATAGVAIEEIYPDRVAGTAHSRTIDKLQSMGFRIMLQQSLELRTKDFPAADLAYHNYERLQRALQSLIQANPKLVSLFSIGKTWNKKDIWCLRFNTAQSGTQPSAKPGALFVGEHHAREHLSVEMPLKIAEYLAAHQDEPAVKKLLDSRDIFIIPMLNPDGAEYDVSEGSYKMHRKNMRKNPDGQLGVDLNRNCDFVFGGAGSSGDTYSDVYHGPRAFSEPETKALRDFVKARPNIKTMNSFHSYSALILYPWGGTDSPISDEKDLKAFQAMAAAMAGMTGYEAQQSNEMYVATGDCADWAYAERHVFAFTTELAGSGFYPGAAQIDKEAPGQIQAALYLLEYSDDPHRAAAAAGRAARD